MSGQNITVQVTGGTARNFSAGEVRTVKDAMDKMGISHGHTAMVNGQPASLNDRVSEFSFVTFSPAIKGGC